MADKASQFTVTELKPERIGGGSNASYNLTQSSVNPTRIVGSDDAGMPVEESIPTAYSRYFVGLDGCIKDVPMRTAAVFSMEPEAERYEMIVTKEIIGAGQLPLDACPYTYQYQHAKRGPLVAVPAGESDCGGSATLIRDGYGQITSGGCTHMQKVIDLRKSNARVKHEKLQEQSKTMKTEDVERLMETTAKAFGVAMQNNARESNKDRLRNGQGEK